MQTIREIAERFWNDVAGLPWKDKVWLNNESLKEQTRQHYVGATTDDLQKIVEQPALKIVVDKLDAMMADKPSKELADVSNYLQELLNKEENNAPVPSNDQTE